MKFLKLVALVAALALFATACGDDTSVAVDTAAAEQAREAHNAEQQAMAAEEAAMEEDEAMAEEEAAMEDEATMEDEPTAEEAMEDEAMADAELRIVSLSPTATEMLFAIGAGDLVVAADDFSNYPAEAPTTDLSGFTPNVEAIAGFEPTLVVSSGPIDGLDALGIDNMVFGAATTFDDVYAQIEQLGAATDHVGEAAEVVANMQGDIKAVLASLPERETPLTYYHELDPTLYSVTSTTFVGEVYKLLGLENAADAADPEGEAFGYPQLNAEYLVTADPDIIFLADTKCCDVTADSLAERAGWDQLTAVQEGNVVELDDDIASRWGPRLVDFVQVAGQAVAAIDAVPAS